jgi:hypothetical protein
LSPYGKIIENKFFGGFGMKGFEKINWKKIEDKAYADGKAAALSQGRQIQDYIAKSITNALLEYHRQLTEAENDIPDKQ